MAERPRGWNKYEAAILLEGLLDVLDKGAPRKEIIKRVSFDLREMARQQGEEIDEIFRNENGIFFQMESMESALKGYTATKKPATKLFTQVVNLYKTDRLEYDRILREARAMINKKQSCEADFMAWLSTKVSPAQLSELYWCYTEIESVCQKAKILSSPLFETTDVKTIRFVHRYIEQDKIFRTRHLRQYSKLISASRYYLTYITEVTAQAAGHEGEKEDQTPASPQIVAEAVPMKEAAAPATQSRDTAPQTEKLIARENEIAGDAERDALTPTLPEIVTEKGNPNDVSAPASKSEVAQETVPQVEEPTADNDSALDEKELEPEILSVDFELIGNFAYTKPCYFSYFEESKEPFSSWTELYVTFFATLEEDYPHIFKSGMSFSPNGGRTELATVSEASGMIAPKPVPGTDYMLETNISASDIVRKMKYILDLCAVDYENVVIRYTKKPSSIEKQGMTIARPQNLSQQFSRIDRLSFYQYLLDVQKLSPATSRSYSSAIGSCETFAKEQHYASWRLYTSNLSEAQATVDALFRDSKFIEYNDRWHNQLRAAITKLLAFISGDGKSAVSVTMTSRTSTPTPVSVSDRAPEYHNEPYERVLREKFQRGFRLDSAIEVRRFRKSYQLVHGTELKDSDDKIVEIIRCLCIQCKDRCYLPDAMLSEDLREKLFTYIENSFSSGKTAIYFQAICTEFSEDFLDYPLHNDPEALKAYLIAVGNGRFYINRSSISKEANAITDPLTEIRTCLQEYGRPVKYEELFAALSHLPQSKIKMLLATNGEFISNGQGAYFHESAVQLSEEELENIAQIIEQTIADKDFIGGNELYEAIQAKYPYIIENNYEFSVYGFRDALKYKFGNRFSFKGNIISAAGKELSMTDVFANYARKHDSFTLAELEMLAADLSSPIYFDAVYENCLRISKEQFVSKKQAQFNVADTDAAIDRVCVGDYVAISRVNNFGIFPYAGFPWNSFLLEHYVYAYSKDYRLLNAGFHKTECTSAIVKRSIGIDNLDDFIVLLLTDADVELEKAPVLQFLVDNGYLARRRYTNIEKLIIRARAQRKERKQINDVFI